MCVFFLNFVRILLWELVYVFQTLQNRMRCLAVSILEYNINWNSKSAERAKALWFSGGRTK